MNTDREYQVIVTYATSTEGHDEDHYCSGNEDVDWVKLGIHHSYHHLGCRGVYTEEDYRGEVTHQTCEGRHHIDAASFSEYQPPEVKLPSRPTCQTQQWCDPKPPDVVTIGPRWTTSWKDQKQVPQSLQISDFHPDEDYSLDLSDKELEKIAHNIGHCRAEVVAISRDTLTIPNNYEYVGQNVDRERLHGLFYFRNKGTDSCSSGYCEAGQGTYYIPIRALLIKLKSKA